MKTAEDLIKKFRRGDNAVVSEDVKSLMIEFAKMHLKAAKKEISEKAKTKQKEIPYQGVRAGGSYFIDVIDKNSILKAYPTENIV